MMLAQGGLFVEEFVLAGTTFHEHEDDVLGLGREVRPSWGRGGWSWGVRRQQVSERERTDTGGALAEEVAATDLEKLLEVHGLIYSRVTNSSRLRSRRPR